MSKHKRIKSPISEHEEAFEKGLTVEDLLPIPLVTDCVFHHLGYSDLLSFALVSKSWNAQVRDNLRRQRTNLLKCKFDQENSLQHLLDHLSDDNSRIHQLFTGVHICIKGQYELDISRPTDLQSQTRTQLRNLFGLFPMKHVIVTFEGYTFYDLPVTYFALEFILAILPENQLETLKIIGLKLKHSAEFLWKSLPIKGSPKLKTVQMGNQDYELPLETELLVGDIRWRKIYEYFSHQIEYERQEKERKANIFCKLANLNRLIKFEDIRAEMKVRIAREIEVLTSKLQDEDVA